ncbi:MAG: hypothetical protein OXQ29_12110, partial [Rhodospirillaceae bacterium]|nr:hypothetical protein [Rhodospirillaceae bacterium]
MPVARDCQPFPSLPVDFWPFLIRLDPRFPNDYKVPSGFWQSAYGLPVLAAAGVRTAQRLLAAGRWRVKMISAFSVTRSMAP